MSILLTPEGWRLYSGWLSLSDASPGRSLAKVCRGSHSPLSRLSSRHANFLHLLPPVPAPARQFVNNFVNCVLELSHLQIVYCQLAISFASLTCVTSAFSFVLPFVRSPVRSFVRLYARLLASLALERVHSRFATTCSLPRSALQKPIAHAHEAKHLLASPMQQHFRAFAHCSLLVETVSIWA